MKLEILAQLLQDAGLGTIGTDIYVHSMPADVRKGILLRDPLAGTKVDPGLPGYYRSRLQAIVRAPAHAEGKTLSDAVAKKLEMGKRIFNNDDGSLSMQVNYIYLEQLPIVYPWTPANALEWSLNFVTSYVEPR
ncbi:hypothetical protein IVB12_16010 [Bradyrhizobium sp. 179]|uniref:minor capsid protein n=1 Tax=Bradyrhizobium sp. 179 TaxID=2782648 RepID=UPI001FFB6C90|nr:minor capsid protein [Bradyrhizobium sp. 179]MCK1543422.1 hypothetical protein [Bradyrhizobium sp. 179]